MRKHRWLKYLFSVLSSGLVLFLFACGGGGGGGAPSYTQDTLEGIWYTENRYFFIDDKGELADVEPVSREVIHDFSGSFEVDNRNITGTIYLDHTPGGGVRNAHEIDYSGLFVNKDEIDVDWDVPGAETGLENWRRVSYTGIIDQAVITAENASIIAVGTWINGDTGASVGILGAVAEVQEDTSADNGVDAMLFLFDNVILQTIPNETSGAIVGTVQGVEETINGTCGGNARLVGSGDDQTGEIEGTITFNNYCDAGVTLNGVAEIFMHIDLVSEDIYHYLFTFKNLTALQEGYSSTIDGRIGANYVMSPPNMLLSYVVNDNLTGKSFWLKDLIIEMIEGISYVDITSATGRYYDPDYGYVEYNIVQTIRSYDGDAWPASGTMIFFGADNTKIRFTFISATEFLVEADTDGDGAYDDYSSGTQLWSEL